MSEFHVTQTSSDSSGVPSASRFTASPLRNRICVELDAPVSEVWELMGDLSRFPEYSVGLERVEVKPDEAGRCKEYTCYFKPLEEGSDGAVSRDVMKWYEPNRGYLSVEVEGGNTVALMTLDPAPGGTRVNYDMHFDAEDLDATKAAIDAALVDIAENLVDRYGGRITDRRWSDAPPMGTATLCRSWCASSSTRCTGWRCASSATPTTPRTPARRS